MPPNNLNSASSSWINSCASPSRRVNTVSGKNSTSPTEDSLRPPLWPHPLILEASPVESSGTTSTDTTEIEDGPREEEVNNEGSSDLRHLRTRLTPELPHSNTRRISPSHTGRSDDTIVSPSSSRLENKRNSMTSPLNTDLPPSKGFERPTPRAQTREDVEDELKEREPRGPNLAGIPERLNNQFEYAGESLHATGKSPLLEGPPGVLEEQTTSLKSALSECWTLCNRLASLSSTHRTRIFSHRGKPGLQEEAWSSCWALCEHLYEAREEHGGEQVLTTLELTRSFCQALFDVRQKGDESTDSVLRVNFEMSNHMYNGFDRNLPSAFHERTLDFYVTLCHRIMRLRTALPEETDDLLHTCWALVVLLFQLRQDQRDGEPPDEELWASAVQACWDLCDLFREGWTQVRPDRGTPRPVQGSFTGRQSVYSGRTSPSLQQSSSGPSFPEPSPAPPETPTTIFDDTNENLEEIDPQILVFGSELLSSSTTSSNAKDGNKNKNNTTTTTTTTRAKPRPRLSSSAVSIATSTSTSAYSSTSTPHPPPPSTSTTAIADANLARLRMLILRAAFKAGYKQPSPTPSHQHNQAFLTFVSNLAPTVFGAHAAQTAVLDRYKKLVAGWPAFCRRVGGTGATAGLLVGGVSGTRRAAGGEVARGVVGVVARAGEGSAWLGDLFWVVVGCRVDDEVGVRGIELVV